MRLIKIYAFLMQAVMIVSCLFYLFDGSDKNIIISILMIMFFTGSISTLYFLWTWGRPSTETKI